MAERRPTDISAYRRAPAKRAWLLRTPLHYYLGVAGLATAVAACLLNLWAYYDEGLRLTEIAFAAAVLSCVILFFTWFVGVFLLMIGVLPRRSLLYLLVHATLGSLSPLLFTIVIGLQMDTLGVQPVGDVEVEIEILVAFVLLAQFFGGRWMTGSGA